MTNLLESFIQSRFRYLQNGNSFWRITFARTIMQHLHFFQSNEAAADHFVQRRQKGVDLFLAIHDFNDERQIRREPQNFRGVQAAGLAKAHRPAQHCRAGEMLFAGGQHDGFVKRLVFPAVAFADENPQQDGVSWNLHNQFLVNRETHEQKKLSRGLRISRLISFGGAKN